MAVVHSIGSVNSICTEQTTSGGCPYWQRNFILAKTLALYLFCDGGGETGLGMTDSTLPFFSFLDLALPNF